MNLQSKTLRTLAWYFFFTFLISWAIWFTTVAQDNGLLSFHIPQSLAFWIGLFIATYIFAFFTGGKPAVKDLAKRVVRWNVGWQPYVIAIGVPIAIAIAVHALSLLFGTPPAVGKDAALSVVPVYLLIEWWLFLMTEETAWRGYVLPRLQSIMSPLRAGLIFGLIWSIWHIPLFLMADTFQSTIPYLGFAISTVATSLFITWLFNVSRGSVLIAAIFHAFTDVSIVYFGTMSNLTYFWLAVAAQVIVGLWAATKLRGMSLEKKSELIYVEE